MNEDRTRLITDELSVFAAAVGYVGEVRDGEFVGQHAGCFRTPETAAHWLHSGGDPDFTMPYSVARKDAPQ